MRSALIALSFAVVSSAAAAQVTVPNTFSAGTPAKAAEVNANFEALVNAINALSARVNKLDGTSPLASADFVGTYAITHFQTELGGGGNPYVSVYTLGGTITLAANGTAAGSAVAELGHTLYLNGTLEAVNRPEPAGTVPWSYSGGTLTLFGGPVTVALGGRMLLRSGSGGNGTNHIIIFTRTN